MIVMKKSTENILCELCARYPALESAKQKIASAFELLQDTLLRGKKLMVCGNGGSAADSEHIVGELMKSFKKHRPIDGAVYERLSAFGSRGRLLQDCLEGTMKALSLTSHIALSTAFANDKNAAVGFAQQLYGLGEEGDALICISTSGNAENCVLAAIVAKAKDIRVLALTGQRESELSALSDLIVDVPACETYRVQELHLPVYHCLCAMLEEENFD